MAQEGKEVKRYRDKKPPHPIIEVRGLFINLVCDVHCPFGHKNALYFDSIGTIGMDAD